MWFLDVFLTLKFWSQLLQQIWIQANHLMILGNIFFISKEMVGPETLQSIVTLDV